ARFYEDNQDLLTLKYDDNNVLGTADYVSPEQAENSHDVDVRTDVYSLGATFYFLLAGRPPFPEGQVAQKVGWHQTRPPTPRRRGRRAVRRGRAGTGGKGGGVAWKRREKRRGARYRPPGGVGGAGERGGRGRVAPPGGGELRRFSGGAGGAGAGPRTPVPRASA